MEQIFETLIKQLLSTNSIGVAFGLVCLVLMLQQDRATRKKEVVLSAKLDEKDAEKEKLKQHSQDLNTQLAVLQSQLSSIEEERIRASEEHLKYHHQEREQLLGLAKETTTLMTELNIFVSEVNKKLEEVGRKVDQIINDGRRY